MRARLSSRPWSFYVKVWIVAYCGLFGLLMTVFVPEGFQMALSHVRGSLSTSQPSGMSSSSSRDAVENTCPPCDCRSCVGENTHGNEVRRFPTLPPNEAMVSSTPWPQDSGVNKRVEMLSAKMAHPLLQFASREKHIAHADMANEVVHVSQGQQNMTSSSSSSSSLSLSCQLLRKKWLARDLNDNVRGIPQQDSLYVRTPCASPVCIRRRDWECTQNPISHITRDGIIMRKGNLQPCCDDLLDTLIVTVIGIFSRHNITAFPAMGSLLSTVRDGRINPWTGDADVAVMQYEETWKPKLIADFNAAGLIYFESSWGRVCFHLNHPGLNEVTQMEDVGDSPRMDELSVMLDVWSVRVDPESMLVFGEAFDACLLNFSDVFPTRLCTMGNFHAPLQCPKNAEKWFGLKWGADSWKTPIKKKHGTFNCRGSELESAQYAKKFKDVYKRTRPIPLLWDGVGFDKWYQCMMQGASEKERKRLEDEWYVKPQW